MFFNNFIDHAKVRRAKIEPEKHPAVFGSRQRKGEQAIWQRRFWEQRIRTESDLNHHIDYIHYNPVKHGLLMRPVDWQYGCQLNAGHSRNLIVRPVDG